MNVIAEKLTNDLTALADYEGMFAEGETGELHIYLEQELSQEQIGGIEQDLCDQGVVLTGPIVQDAMALLG